MVEKEFVDKLVDAILNLEGEEGAAAKLVEEALKNGLDPGEAMEALAATGSKVGDLFAADEIFLADLILAGEEMRAVSEVLRTVIGREEAERRALGKVVIGTVQGDIHDLGKNIVSTMLASSGFDVRDIGADCNPDKFLDEAEDFGADVIAMSCLLTSCLPGVAGTIKLLTEEGIREKCRVIIGGGALNEKIVADMRADGYGPDSYVEDAISAVGVVRKLLRR